jgi:hypothetical protein
VPFWRREEPLHEKLAREGGLREPAQYDPRASFRETLVGVHGVHRAREWDAVATAVAPGLAGDRVVFVVLPGDVLLIEEGEGGEVEPLVQAVEGQLELPYRIVAVRQEDDRWGVAANRIQAYELPGLPGHEITLTLQGMSRELRIDGTVVDESVPALEELADYDAYVLEAERLDGDLWEVRVTPL